MRYPEDVKAQGALVISIDYEYAWGYADHNLSAADLARIRGEEEITRRLLALFEKYKIPATWAIVGKLLESGEDAAWHDRRLIKEIAGASAQHEIGSHSFGHILYDRAGEAAVQKDVENFIRAHAAAGLSAPASFVFPRNLEGHHVVLKEHGLKVYRGLRARWYHHLPGPVRRAGHLIDSVLPLYKGVRPAAGEAGLITLPDSALLFARNGVRRFIPASLSGAMFVRGMRAAAARQDIFHVWFHPSNFSYDTEVQFAIFERILREASALRARGALNVVTMQGAAARYL